MNKSKQRALIIGAGQAGGQCAASLRQLGWPGEILLVGAENYPPYQRPPLSKAFLSGALGVERLFLKPDIFYESQNIELRLGTTAEKIDRAKRHVVFQGGATIDYDTLILATGARVRKFNAPGAPIPGVFYLRTIDDVVALKKKFQPGARIAIVGAGYIGLEVAAIASKAGLSPCIIEIADRVLSRVAGPVVSKFFEGLHRSHGVDFKMPARVKSFEGEEALRAIVFDDGSRLEADIALIGIGVAPNAELAADAGLEFDDGIVVNEFACTSDPSIYAIGDCTRHPSAYLGAPLRLESVHNALEQAKTAAAAICGNPKAYNEPPWFWSDQYDVKLQTVGICANRFDREIIRGDVAAKKFSVFYMERSQLIAVDSINAPGNHMVSRRLITQNIRLSDDQITDPSFNLRSLLG